MRYNIFLYFLFSTCAVFASIGGHESEAINSFVEQASSSAIVVIGDPQSVVANHPEFLDVYDSHRFYYIKVSRVLAANREYVNQDGEIEVPEYLLVCDNLGLGMDNFARRCDSVFFLWPIFSNDDGQRLGVNRETVSDVLKHRNVEINLHNVFELASGNVVFPIIDFRRFKEDRPNLDRWDEKKALWDYRQSELQRYWGLSNFSEVETFVTKALIPFFEQIDNDWFFTEVEHYNSVNPLHLVVDEIKRRQISEKSKVPFSYDRAIGMYRRPFTGGEVLSSRNLSESFKGL